MDKQLREAIYTILRHPNNKLADNDIRVQRSIRHEIREEQTDQLLALFHTYGNRERINELEKLKEEPLFKRKVVDNEDLRRRTGYVRCRVRVKGLIDSRIAELNREVES